MLAPLGLDPSNGLQITTRCFVTSGNTCEERHACHGVILVTFVKLPPGKASGLSRTRTPAHWTIAWTIFSQALRTRFSAKLRKKKRRVCLCRASKRGSEHGRWTPTKPWRSTRRLLRSSTPFSNWCGFPSSLSASPPSLSLMWRLWWLWVSIVVVVVTIVVEIVVQGVVVVKPVLRTFLICFSVTCVGPSERRYTSTWGRPATLNMK